MRPDEQSEPAFLRHQHIGGRVDVRLVLLFMADGLGRRLQEVGFVERQELEELLQVVFFIEAAALVFHVFRKHEEQIRKMLKRQLVADHGLVDACLPSRSGSFLEEADDVEVPLDGLEHLVGISLLQLRTAVSVEIPALELSHFLFEDHV